MESEHPTLPKLTAPPKRAIEPVSEPEPTITTMLHSTSLAEVVDNAIEVEMDRRRQEELELLGRLSTTD